MYTFTVHTPKFWYPQGKRCRSTDTSGKWNFTVQRVTEVTRSKIIVTTQFVVEDVTFYSLCTVPTMVHDS